MRNAISGTGYGIQSQPSGQENSTKAEARRRLNLVNRAGFGVKSKIRYLCFFILGEDCSFRAHFLATGDIFTRFQSVRYLNEITSLITGNY